MDQLFWVNKKFLLLMVLKIKNPRCIPIRKTKIKRTIKTNKQEPM